MPNKTEAIKMYIAKHLNTYGAPLGKRSCKYEHSDTCLGIAPESHFHGHMCKECRKYKMVGYYDARMIRRGEDGNPLRKGPGRPRKIEEAIVLPKKVSSRKLSTSKTG